MSLNKFVVVCTHDKSSSIVLGAFRRVANSCAATSVLIDVYNVCSLTILNR
jgi:hypothetical protein